MSIFIAISVLAGALWQRVYTVAVGRATRAGGHPTVLGPKMVFYEWSALICFDYGPDVLQCLWNARKVVVSRQSCSMQMCILTVLE